MFPTVWVLSEFYISKLLGWYLLLPISWYFVNNTNISTSIYSIILLICLYVNYKNIGINYRCSNVKVRLIHKIIYLCLSLIQIVMSLLILYPSINNVPLYMQIVLYWILGLNIFVLSAYMLTLCFTDRLIDEIHSKYYKLIIGTMLEHD